MTLIAKLNHPAGDFNQTQSPAACPCIVNKLGNYHRRGRAGQCWLLRRRRALMPRCCYETPPDYEAGERIVHGGTQ